MTTSELISYIKKQIDKNIPKNTIISKLLGAGWHIEDINESFNLIESELKQKPILEIKNEEIVSAPNPIITPVENKIIDKYHEPIEGDSVVDLDKEIPNIELPKLEEIKKEVPEVQIPVVEKPKPETIKVEIPIVTEVHKVEPVKIEPQKIWTPTSVPIKEKIQTPEIKKETNQIEIQNLELAAKQKDILQPEKKEENIKSTSSIVDLQNPDRNNGLIPNLIPKMAVNSFQEVKKDENVNINNPVIKEEIVKDSLYKNLPKIAMLSSYQNDIVSFKNKAKEENSNKHLKRKIIKWFLIILGILVVSLSVAWAFKSGYIDIKSFNFIKKDPKVLLINNSKVLSELKSYKTETSINITSLSFSNISYGLITGEAVPSLDKDSISIDTLGKINQDSGKVISDNLITIKSSILQDYITTDIKNDGVDLFVLVPDLNQILKENAPESSIVQINEQQFDLIPPLFSLSIESRLSKLNIYKILSSGISSYINNENLGVYNDFINNAEIVEKGQENIKGIDTYHYRINADRQSTKNLLMKISNNFVQNLSDEDNVRLEEIIGSVTINSLDIWVGKGDNNIYQYSLVLDVPLSKIIGFEDKSIGDNTVSVSFKTTYYDFNVSNDIAMPENSISVIDFVKKVKEMKMKNNLNSFQQLATNLQSIEKVYGNKSNTKGVCMSPNSGSLFSPIGHPVKANAQVSAISLFLNNILGITGGMGSCYSNPKAWSFAIPVTDNYDPSVIPEGGYTSFYCVDSTGSSQDLSTLPVGVVCK